MSFDFSVPLTWSDIISALALLAAIIAAIIAVRGNRQSQKQFADNMKKQEQAINLSLFDARTRILEQIIDKDFSFSRDRAGFLFNSEIISLLDQYHDASMKKSNTEDIQSKFLSILKETAISPNQCDAEEARDFLEYIKGYESMLPDENVSEKEYQERRESIRNKRMTFKVEPINADYQSYSYIDLEDDINNIAHELEKIRTKIIAEMKNLIGQSVPGKEDIDS